MANKKKITTAVVAGVTAVALVLGGTFAWTSISQQARNEAIVDINPGGRLHDDFNGTNKDVYVENFGDTLTGVPIYARIRLDQYMEVGPDAGMNLTDDMGTRNVRTVIGGDSDDVTTWVTYKPDEIIENGTVQALENWTWTLGNDEDHKPVYLPTFNMNKDSLAADINGTWQGTVKGDIVHYDDYKVYEENKPYTGTEVYDWDDDDNTEEETPIITTDSNTPRDSADVYTEEAEHTATKISSGATVMTMAQWIAAGSPSGPYWVYDTDGWAYWTQPIEPQTTTGLLLDAITLSRVPDENYYYGINVVGQFATAGDLNAFADNDGGMTDEALELIASIANAETYEIAGPTLVVPHTQVQYSLNRYIAGVETDNQPNGRDVVWSAEAVDPEQNDVTEYVSDGSLQSGILWIDPQMPEGSTVTLTATYNDIVIDREIQVRYLSASFTKNGVELTPLHSDGSNLSRVYQVEADFIKDEMIVIKSSHNINLEETITRTSLSDKGVTLTLEDVTTLVVTFTGEQPVYRSTDVNNVWRSVSTVEIVTDDNLTMMVYIYKTLKKAENITLQVGESTYSDSEEIPVTNGSVLSVSGFDYPSDPYFYLFDESGTNVADSKFTLSSENGSPTINFDTSNVTDGEKLTLRVTDNDASTKYCDFTLVVTVSSGNSGETTE